jgi:hypothetical protein
MGNVSAQLKAVVATAASQGGENFCRGSDAGSNENNKKQNYKHSNKTKQIEFINRIKSTNYDRFKSSSATTPHQSATSSSSNGNTSSTTTSHGGLSLFSMFYLDYNQFATKGIHFKLNKHQYNNSGLQPFYNNNNKNNSSNSNEVAIVSLVNSANANASLIKRYDKLQSNILTKSNKFLKDLEKNAHKRLLCVCFQALASLTSNNEEARRAVSDNSDLIGKIVECIQFYSEINNNENNPKMSGGGGTANSSVANKKLVRTIFYDITDTENNVKLAPAKGMMNSDDDDDDDEDEEDYDEDDDDDEDVDDEENPESSSFEAFFSSCCDGHNEVDMNQESSKEANVDGNILFLLLKIGPYITNYILKI